MRSVFLHMVLAGAALAVAACGGGGYSSSTSPAAPSTTPASPSAVTITISGQNGAQSFSPNPASVGGQLVVFRNTDTIPHHVVLNDGSLDTGDIAPGATSRSIMMPASGTNYHCSLHPGMIGAVSPSAGGQAPPCTGLYCDPNY
jgi:plastocyanin